MAKASGATKSAPAKAKLSYKEQRELDALPARIEALEAEQKTLHEQLASPGLYTQSSLRAGDLHARNEAIDAELMAALERWEVLGSR